MFQQREFEGKLVELINFYSAENMSDTPDYILATYLMDCLRAYNTAVNSRTTHAKGIVPRM